MSVSCTRIFGLCILAASLLVTAGAPARAAELVVAEPLHGVGYLPLYVAVHNGYFNEQGDNVTILTVESGSGHTNAVLTKQAFAFIGGPEHNAFAKAKGAELRAVVNVVNRGNVYFVAAKDAKPHGSDLAGFVKGKRVATGFYGGTPNSITRYMLNQWKLDARSDVTMTETSSGAILAALKSGQADIGVITEPILTQGIRQGIWGEPVYNVPKELGYYAYSTLNIRKESMDREPKQVEGFVRAVIKGLQYTFANPAGAAAIARKEFPTMALEDLTATLDRSFKDDLWSHDGMVERKAWETGSKVVRTADILKVDVPYDDIIDMRFVKAVLSTQ
jgi:NitT/TauT family transport system substrate-binding protein